MSRWISRNAFLHGIGAAGIGVADLGAAGLASTTGGRATAAPPPPVWPPRGKHPIGINPKTCDRA
jgi:hypothetical protein